jgi:hypothetical protein
MRYLPASTMPGWKSRGRELLAMKLGTGEEGTLAGVKELPGIIVGASEALGGGVWAPAPTLRFGGENSAAPGILGSKPGSVLPSSSIAHPGEDLEHGTRPPNRTGASITLKDEPILRDEGKYIPPPNRSTNPYSAVEYEEQPGYGQTSRRRYRKTRSAKALPKLGDVQSWDEDRSLLSVTSHLDALAQVDVPD